MSVHSENSASSSLYKYVVNVTFEGLRRMLAGTVRFTQPSGFNDPFELLPEVVMPLAEPNRRINVQFDLFGKRREPPVRGEVDVIPDGQGSGDPTSRDIVQQLNNIIGFLCLSKNARSLLMYVVALRFLQTICWRCHRIRRGA